jgi:hypothetical protein
MFLYNIESMAKKMSIDYQEVTSHIEHMGMRGSSRENMLREYIGQLLPQKFAVGNGIIVDVNGIQSKQQDFFVYDAFNSPVFLRIESSCVIPVESVYATVEVKSTLTKETLKQSIENIRSVKQLKIAVLKNSPFIPPSYNFILGTVFAYTSDSAIETVAQNVSEICKDIPKDEQPSIICIFDKGLIVNVSKAGLKEIVTVPSDLTTWGIIKKEKEVNYYLFYLILQQHLNSTINFPPDLLKYAEMSHAVDDLKVYIPKDMIPEDVSIELGKTKLSGEELKFLGENYQIIFKLLTHQVTKEELGKIGKTPEEIKAIGERFAALVQRSFGVSPLIPEITP